MYITWCIWSNWYNWYNCNVHNIDTIRYIVYIYIPCVFPFSSRRLCGNGEASWAAVRRAGAAGMFGCNGCTTAGKSHKMHGKMHEKCMENIQVLISTWISPENYPCSKRLKRIERSGVWFSWCYGFIRLLISALCRSLDLCPSLGCRCPDTVVVPLHISLPQEWGLPGSGSALRAETMTATVFLQRWKLKVSQRHH